MPKLALTDLSVRSLKSDRQVDYWDTKLPGFGIRVGPRSKTFIVKVNGAPRRTLGSYPSISLQDARRAAQLAKLTPTTPLSSTTFLEAYELFSAMHVRRKKGSTQDNYTGHLDRHFRKPFSGRRLDDITYADIIAITDQLTPSNQAYALAVIRIFWNFCRRRQLTKNNPVETIRVSQSQSRDRVLTDRELQCIWRATDEQTSYNTIVRLLMLTGQRRGEIAALQFSWIHDDHITLPKEITKNGREHTFPIGSLSKSLLENCSSTGTTPFLFPARGTTNSPFNGFSKCKIALDKKLGDSVAPWTLHDLRRTFATNLAALGVRLEVTERLLNHVSGSLGGIVSVYQKHSFMPEMREAILKWEARLSEIISAVRQDETTLST